MKWLTASKTCIDTDKFIVRRWIARRAQKLWSSSRTATSGSGSGSASSNAFDVCESDVRIIRMLLAKQLANGEGERARTQL